MAIKFLRVFAIVVSLAIGHQSQAQLVLSQSHNYNSALRQANKYFEKQAYQHAALLYQRILAEQPDLTEVQLKVADCYRFLSDYQNATFWYQQAIKSNELPGDHWLHYASTLCQQEKYQLAATWYKNYLKHFPDNPRAKASLSSLLNLKKLVNRAFTVRPLSINVNGPVFAPTLWNGGLVFVAPGKTGGIMKKVATWNEDPYYDLYFAKLNNGKLGFPRYLDNKLNSIYHEGPAVFFDRDQQILFTRNASAKSSDKARKLHLMWSKKKANGQWMDAKPININDQGYSIGHPTVNESATVLYFTSDMPGGHGGTDLYKSALVNGIWQKPINLGPEINTSGDEMFPHYQKGLLYYSSNGKGGLGGLDIFVKNLGTSQKATNMGFPMNSPQDDFGIVWQQDKLGGYISSNRQGLDKIYEFQVQH